MSAMRSNFSLPTQASSLFPGKKKMTFSVNGQSIESGVEHKSGVINLYFKGPSPARPIALLNALKEYLQNISRDNESIDTYSESGIANVWVYECDLGYTFRVTTDLFELLKKLYEKPSLETQLQSERELLIQRFCAEAEAKELNRLFTRFPARNRQESKAIENQSAPAKPIPIFTGPKFTLK